MKKRYFSTAHLLFAGFFSLSAVAERNVSLEKLNQITHLQGSQVVISGLNDQQPVLLQAEVKEINAKNNKLSYQQSFLLDTGNYQGFSTATLVDESSATNSKVTTVLYGREGIYRLTDEKVELFIETPSLYQRIDTNTFDLLVHEYDVNSDGLSDFIVPDLDQHHLWVQQKNGDFVHTELNFSLQTSFYQDEYNNPSLSLSLPKSVQVSDVTADGLNDIVVVFSNRVLWFGNLGNNQFSKTATLLKSPVKLDSHYTAVERYSTLDFKDVNSDGFLDLLVEKKFYDEEKNELQSLLLFCGQPGDLQSTKFSTAASFELTIEGEMLQYGLADFNGDSLSDFYYVSGEIGTGSIMSAMFGGGFEVDVVAHQQRANCSFDSNKTTSRSTEFLVDVKNIAFGTFIKIADVNDDGKDDLLLKSNDKTISTFWGSSKKLLSRKASKTSASLSANPALIKLLSANGKSYIVSLGQDIKLTHLKD